jgi:hypothetical protein
VVNPTRRSSACARRGAIGASPAPPAGSGDQPWASDRRPAAARPNRGSLPKPPGSVSPRSEAAARLACASHCPGRAPSREPGSRRHERGDRMVPGAGRRSCSGGAAERTGAGPEGCGSAGCGECTRSFRTAVPLEAPPVARLGGACRLPPRYGWLSRTSIGHRPGMVASTRERRSRSITGRLPPAGFTTTVAAMSWGVVPRDRGRRMGGRPAFRHLANGYRCVTPVGIS